MCSRDWEGCNCGQLATQEKNLPLLFGIRRPQAPTPPPSIDRFLSSLATCWALHASPIHIFACCHSHNTWCRLCKTKTRTPCCGNTKSLYWLALPKIFGRVDWQSRKVPFEAGWSLSNMDVVCATSCYVAFIDSSMHVLLPMCLVVEWRSSPCRVDASRHQHWVANQVYIWLIRTVLDPLSQPSLAPLY
jgi:hypothetical protein